MSAERLVGRRVTVMGLGLQGGGVEVARWLVQRGARVTVTDLRPAHALSESLEQLLGLDVLLVLGEHRAQDFEQSELVVANPAVPQASPWLAAARTAGVPVTSDTELFLAACPARVALVTGTQGKSSTCHLLAGLLAGAGFRTHLGGNIGRSLLGALDGMGADDVAVLEISSYQLEALPKDPRPLGRRVAALAALNLLPDHLERHGSMAAYEAAKRRLLELAGPECTSFLPADDARLSLWSVPHGRQVLFSARPSTRPSTHPDGSVDLWLGGDAFVLDGERLGRALDLRLPGDFQRANALVALGMARSLGARPELLARALGTLRGLEHRLQDLGRVRGHRVWDNGVSTTPDSTLSALACARAPLVLIAGGQAKQLDYGELARAAARLRAVVTFGASGERLAAACAAAGAQARAVATLEEAVAAAFDELQPEDELLFSPACASFDAYRNWEERARAFRAALASAAEEQRHGARSS
jgi:UDP-N-acetylmuramoylalanine--D-glutamate ligase